MTPLAFYTGTKDSFLIKETIAGILILFAWISLVIYKLENRQSLFPCRLFPFLAFYLVSILISAVSARHGWLAVKAFYFQCILTGAYLVSCELTDTEKETLINTLLPAVLITGIYGIFQHFGLDLIKWLSDYGGRPFSSFGNPNFYAGYLVLVIPLALLRAVFLKGSIRYLWAAACLLSLLNLLWSRTAGAWIAFAASMIYSLSLSAVFAQDPKKRTRLLASGLAVAAIALIIAGSRFYKQPGGYFDGKANSVTERVFKWRTALEMIKQYPVTGVGAGNLKVNYALYQAKVRDKAGYELRSTSESNVHNEYLQVFAETGLLGLLGFLGIFIFYFSDILRKNREDFFSPYLSVGVSAGVLGSLVYCLSNFPLRIIPTAVTLFVFMGISENKYIVDSSKGAGERKKHQIPGLRIAGGLIYLFIIYKMSVMPFAADVCRKAGDNALYSGKDPAKAAGYYERSIALDYYNSDRAAFDLGEAYRSLQDCDKAIKAYGISVNLRNYGEVYNCIGNCYWLKQDTANAVKNWETAVGLGLPDPKVQRQVIDNIKAVSKGVRE